MKKITAPLLILVLPLLFADAQEEPGAQEYDVIVSLKEGSRFRSRLPGRELVVRTPYGDQRIPLKEIRYIRRVKEDQIVAVTSEMAIQGRLAMGDLVLETELGTVKVPLSRIARIDLGQKLSLLADDKTVAFWSFDMPGEIPVDQVKRRAMRLQSMSVVEKDGIVALTRRSEKGYAQAPSSQELKFAKGDFTIEARFKIGSTTKGYVTIVSKNDVKNAQIRNYCLLVSSAGNLYWDSLGKGKSSTSTTSKSVIKRNEWAYVAVVVQQSKGRILYYVNGKKVHTHTAKFSIAANNGPVYLGASPPAQSWSGPPERIQFVRLSRGARTPEEILQWNEALRAGARPVIGAGGRGVWLKSGGFYGARSVGLNGAIFRMKYGALALSDASRGEIRLYRFRKHELGAVRKRAAELIGQLGSPSLDARDQAEKALIKIGTPAVEVLMASAKAQDEEIRMRVKAILKKFAETGVAKQPVGDVLRMGGTVLHGWLEAKSLDLETEFGRFQISTQNVRIIRLGKVEVGTGGVLRMRSGEKIQTTKMGTSTLKLITQFGELNIPVSSITSLRFDKKAKQWEVRTKRMTAKGKILSTMIQVDTPAGKIEIPLREVLEFGPPRSETALPSSKKWNPQKAIEWRKMIRERPIIQQKLQLDLEKVIRKKIIRD